MKKSIILLFFFLMPHFIYGQKKENNLTGIEQDIETLLKSYNAVGLSVAVVKNNEIIYSKGFGYRNLEEKLPVSTNTVFPIGSMTKAFTASLLGMLESEGEVSLKEKPAFYLPQFQFYTSQMDNLIKVEDLLSHKSGIGNQGTTLSLFPEEDKLKMVQRLKYLKPQGEILNSWHYSNMGYTLAGTIVETVTKKSWSANLQTKIFKPLNMNTSFTSLEEMKSTNDFSVGYGVSNDNIERVLYENFYSYSPAGAIKSNSNDMGNWMLSWLNKGKFNEKQILPEKYLQSAITIHNIRPQEGADADSYLYGDGFGWRVESFQGHYKVHHGGNTSGFSSHLVMFPNEKIGIVVLTNQDNSLLPYMISYLISSRMLNLPKTDIKELPVIVGDIYKPKLEDKTTDTKNQTAHSSDTNLEMYTGNYFANGYGIIKVTQENQRLFVQFPTFKFMLEHLNLSTFYMRAVEAIPQIMNPKFTIQFINDTKGNISTLKLYSQDEPIEFVKEKK